MDLFIQLYIASNYKKMDYSNVLRDIVPSQSEIENINVLIKDIISFIDNLSSNNGLKAETLLVGSVAKNTWLSGKADIDIFIHFPLETPEDVLKEKGLFLAYECINHFNGVSEERYASHPYVTGFIGDYEVDFVPCYKISKSEELKSAVDRTILHTNYMLSHLSSRQTREVLLLKKFMGGVETYGSEFKTGGFAGYLCEIFILKYGSFEETLRATRAWDYGFVIDLEDYGTSSLFDDVMVVIDPTDANRNVAASLTKEKFLEFKLAAYNFLNNPKEEYFSTYIRPINGYSVENCNVLLESFNNRESDVLGVVFPVPDLSVDSVYPQLKKTELSLHDKLDEQGFNVIKSASCDVIDGIGLLLFELGVNLLPKYWINYGPSLYYEKACLNFQKAHDECYIIDDFLVSDVICEHRTPSEFLNFLFDGNLHLFSVGKNLAKGISEDYKLYSINELLENSKFLGLIENNDAFIQFLYDFLHPQKYLQR